MGKDQTLRECLRRAAAIDGSGKRRVAVFAGVTTIGAPSRIATVFAQWRVVSAVCGGPRSVDRTDESVARVWVECRASNPVGAG